MPGGYARKRMHDGHTRLRRRMRLRRKTKDLDQVSKTREKEDMIFDRMCLFIYIVDRFGFKDERRRFA